LRGADEGAAGSVAGGKAYERFCTFRICNPLFAIRKGDQGLFSFSSARPPGAHIHGYVLGEVRDTEVKLALDVDVPSLYVRIPSSEIVK
jgi:hypothetical protein